MVDAAIVYNAVYIQNGLLSFQDSLYVGWKLLSINGLMTIALPTTVVGGLYTVFRRNLEKPVKRLFLLGLVVFPIETGLTAVSGRSYPHYYIAWLPSMAIFAGMFGHLLMKLGDKASTPNNFRSRLIILILVLALFGLFLPIGIQFYARLQYGRSVVTVGQLGVEYIKQETSPADYVLMWGAETGINFASERRSPSRFTYQYPLFHGAENVDEFLLDIQRNSPVLIIDAVNTITKAYVPDALSIATLMAMSSGASNDHLPQWSAFADYLAENYEMVDILGESPTEWFVYRKIERPSAE